MTNWFDLSEENQWEQFGQTENGYGLEKFNIKFGSVVGHTDGTDGFGSFGFYFPKEGMTYILFFNGIHRESNAPNNIFISVSKIMFE